MIDSHAHLNDASFDDDFDLVIKRSRQAGLKYIINVAEDLVSSQKALKQSELIPELFCSVGWHPHKASHFTEDDGNSLKKLFSLPKVKAIGEIGLDYHYNFSTPEDQIKVFRRFLDLSLELDFPVVIHCREAENDILKIIEECKKSNWKGVFHCFTGSLDFAKEVLQLGFHVSFSGIITFNNADDLQNVAKNIPNNKLLVETDAPYLSPLPFRGKRNEPANINNIIKKIAILKNIDLDVLIDILSQNTINLFSLE